MYRYLSIVLSVFLVSCSAHVPEKDATADIKDVRVAAKQGNVEAQFILGVRTETWATLVSVTAPTSGDGLFKEAFDWYKKAALQGYANAENALGRMYDDGKGVKQDCHKAVEWYAKAANKGLGAAQCNLGHMYAEGRGVKKDFQKATEWYEKAAAQNDPTAVKVLENGIPWVINELEVLRKKGLPR